MFDNSPDEDDGGLDQVRMNDLALLLANTDKDLQTVLEDLGWEWSNDILREVLHRVGRCEGCHRWVSMSHLKENGATCANCKASVKQERPWINIVGLDNKRYKIH